MAVIQSGAVLVEGSGQYERARPMEAYDRVDSIGCACIVINSIDLTG